MTTDLFSCDHADEFEFQMDSSSSERETISPADELFYKGKFLPLHLPPHLQMVERILQKSDFYQNKEDEFDGPFNTPSITNANTTPTANTPFQPCNIPPSESCQFSREFNSKVKKQSSLGLKLKASRAYLKSFFSKSTCMDESSERNIKDESVPKAREFISKYSKMAKEVPFSQIPKDKDQMSTTGIRSVNKEKFAMDNGDHHRRSFSGAIKRLSTTKSSSSLFPSRSSTSLIQRNSNSFHGLQFHKRSSGKISEIENTIQGAIAHCKTSQQQVYPNKCNK